MNGKLKSFRPLLATIARNFLVLWRMVELMTFFKLLGVEFRCTSLVGEKFANEVLQQETLCCE